MIECEYDYCGDPLCPEECAEAKSKQQEGVNSQEVKTLSEVAEVKIWRKV